MRHLAIIADGNRRWAKKNNLPLELGYMQGLQTIEQICEWAITNKIEYLSFYCFSTENWKRETSEVDMLFNLAFSYLEKQTQWYIEKNIRVLFNGNRFNFSQNLVKSMEKIERDTKNCKELTLVICVDYGGRDEIIRAISCGARTQEDITKYTTQLSPEPDVILRTGGQMRLSNFMLWQSAYSELFFLSELFPELNKTKLDFVFVEYKNRKRKYGE